MVDHIDETLAYEENAESYDANDPAAVEVVRKAAARDKEDDLRVVELIMSSEKGRKWVFKKLNTECHVFRGNPCQDTPERNALFEGERNIGLRLMEEIMQAAPEMFWLMRMEAIDRDRHVSVQKTDE